MASLKLVAVLITAFTKIKEPAKMAAYIWGCMTDGMASTLYASPAIIAAFYTAGNNAWAALDLAISNHNSTPTPNNLKIVKAKMALVVIWLKSYASQVQVIANLPINATTREEVVINIGNSYLTAQKLTRTTKGDPQVPALIGKNIGTSTIEVEVTNSIEFNPTSIVFIAVEVPVTPVTDPPSPVAPPAEVDLTNGQLTVTSTVAVQTATISLTGKGRIVTFTALKPGVQYAIYAYTMNGKKLRSVLSVPIYVFG